MGDEDDRDVRRAGRSGWLRAAVLGAQDGIVSTAGIVVGMAATGASREVVLTSGLAGAVAGAMSMAAGEYASVSSQVETERADTELERQSLIEDPEGELEQLAAIYRERGLSSGLARRVAEELTAADALGAHRRDELGITDTLRARPLQAAVTSAVTFVGGAALPLLAAVLAPVDRSARVTIVATLIALSLTGGLAARAGGAPVIRGASRVAFWGALAMAATWLVGSLFDVQV